MTISNLCFSAWLIIVLFSCVNPNSSIAKTTNTLASRNDISIDTAHRLRYTSGIRAIHEDSKGNIWFGSHQEGVCVFDGKTFTYYTTDDGLSSNQIRSIYEDQKGVIWFECSQGITSFDGKSLTIHTNPDYSSKHTWQKNDFDLWFKGSIDPSINKLEEQVGMYRYDGKNMFYHVFPNKPNIDQANYSEVSTSTVKGKNGKVWFGTYNAVFGYDGASFTIINNDYLHLDEKTGVLHVRSLFEDSQGDLWIGNNGIGVLKLAGDTIQFFSKEHNLIGKQSMHNGDKSPAGTLEHVFAIGEDDEGNMWFGDRDTGGWKYDGQSMKNYTMKDGLTSTHIWQIYKTKKGLLWFAMADGSVCQFNGRSFDRIF